MLGIVLSTWNVLYHLVFRTTLRDGLYYYTHFQVRKLDIRKVK